MLDAMESMEYIVKITNSSKECRVLTRWVDSLIEAMEE